MRITALCGGLGGARFALALQQAGVDEHATLVTNVADDWTVDGLLVCPDTDAVLYALAGRFDEQRGWGIRGDTFPPPGSGGWFSLGEQDRRHHEKRRALLEGGQSLSEATRQLALEAGVSATVLPATDRARPTTVVTPTGPSAFQEWLVRDGARPRVVDVRWPADADIPSAGVVPAIEAADTVVLTSSSPVASLEPTLTLRGVREALVERGRRGRRTVLISPVVGTAPSLERDVRRHHARAALLAARGVEHDPVAVAHLYADFLTDVVLDPVDAHRGAELEHGLRVAVAPILAQDESSRRLLVEACLRGEVSAPPVP